MSRPIIYKMSDPESPSQDGDYTFTFTVPYGEVWEVLRVKGNSSLAYTSAQISVRASKEIRFAVDKLICLGYGFIYSKPFEVFGGDQIEITFLNATTLETLQCGFQYRKKRG